MKHWYQVPGYIGVVWVEVSPDDSRRTKVEAAENRLAEVAAWGQERAARLDEHGPELDGWKVEQFDDDGTTLTLYTLYCREVTLEDLGPG